MAYGIERIDILFPLDELQEALLAPQPEPEPEPPVTQSLFTTQLPALVNQSDNTYTLGTVLQFSVPGKVHGIRSYVHGVPTTSPIGLFYEFVDNLNGNLLASKPFGTLTAQQWNATLFNTPLAVQANKMYVAAWGPTNNYCATGGFFNAADVVNDKITGLRSLAARLNGKFRTGTSESYPNQSFNGGCYFVDVVFEPTI